MFGISNVCLWDDWGVGTQVRDPQAFLSFLEAQIKHNIITFDEHGHAFIPCPHLADKVACGTARHTKNPKDYGVALHRGEPMMFLRRNRVILYTKADFVAVILYTKAAYMSDPDVDDEERVRINTTYPDCQYVIVTVLGTVGPKAPVSPYRFLKNICGGNPEFSSLVDSTCKDADGRPGIPKTRDQLVADMATLVKMAKDTTDYHEEWCTVADIFD